MSSVPRPRSSSFGDEQAEGDLPVDQLVKTAEQLKNDSELQIPSFLSHPCSDSCFIAVSVGKSAQRLEARAMLTSERLAAWDLLTRSPLLEPTALLYQIDVDVLEINEKLCQSWRWSCERGLTEFSVADPAVDNRLSQQRRHQLETERKQLRDRRMALTRASKAAKEAQDLYTDAGVKVRERGASRAGCLAPVDQLCTGLRARAAGSVFARL